MDMAGASPSRADLVIAGGGLAGCLAALALAQRRPELKLLLVEQEPALGGNHVWSFFDGDVAPEHDWLVQPLVVRRWPAHDIAFPERKRTLALGYNSISSGRLDAVARGRLGPERLRLGARIAQVEADGVLLESGERIGAAAVIDARGAANLSGLDLAWQKFVGRHLRFDPPHGLERPVVMDATVAQLDGYRFLYCLPFSETEMLVEDTCYSASPELDRPMLRGRIEDHAAERGWRVAEVAGEEAGVLPVALGGDVASLWPERDGPVGRLGLRGGFFHPTTGYSLPDAVRNAVLLAERRDLSAAALHSFLRDRAARLWRERRFYRLLNRMLFRAAAPDERWRVLRHFYRLPEERIARFYAGRSTLADKAAVLSGRPPVPVGRALRALAGARG